MLSPEKDRVIIFAAGVFLIFILVVAVFVGGLWPVSSGETEDIIFSVSKGEGFREIADRLGSDIIVRSPTAFKFYSLITGVASKLKPGDYELSVSMSIPDIVKILTSGPQKEVVITISDGMSIYEIDRIMGDKGILKEGEILSYAIAEKLEGKLFPDTYNFFKDSTVPEVVGKFLENFRRKTSDIFINKEEKSIKNILIIASMVEKEVPDGEDRKIIAGIMSKRLRVGMPLQVDATICYIKKKTAYPQPVNCSKYTPIDFKIDSPYNTYLYKGLPIEPIGNPGISAIESVLNQEESPFWYYLSEPENGRTIFSETLDEHNKNRVKYLGL